MDDSEIRALTFDVFGTVVDWRGTIIREGERLGNAKGIEVDWARFADAWRAGYGPSIHRVRLGEMGWTNLDTLHRMVLDELVAEFHITGLTGPEKDHLNRVWHRLDPWPDAIAGVQRLRSKFIVATLSNANVALLTNLSRSVGPHWDCILSAELAGYYKPDAEVYEMAARLLGLRIDQVMMVAAHKPDLIAAQAVGMKTAFVPRPLEFGLQRTVETAPDPTFDQYGIDFEDLASNLGT